VRRELVQPGIVVGAALQAQPVSMVGGQVALAFDAGLKTEPIHVLSRSGLSWQICDRWLRRWVCSLAAWVKTAFIA